MGTVVLTQTGLIERIQAIMNIHECNDKLTPVDIITLVKEENRDPFMKHLEYRLVVGMMLYFTGSTRPDIAYIVHQCARFSHNPKRSHEMDLKHVTQYLKVTLDKRLILTPDVKIRN